MNINIVPDNKHPHPDSLHDEVGDSLKENARVAASTASLMAELGMPFEMTEDDQEEARKLSNRLLEISQCGDVKYELRAIELLGKLSDVGAFTEKSEITVTHKTSDDLRKAIQDKVERLLDMEVVDVEAKTLEEELGIDEPPATTGSAEETTQHS
jgi:hypothetical protein